MHTVTCCTIIVIIMVKKFQKKKQRSCNDSIKLEPSLHILVTCFWTEIVKPYEYIKCIRAY